MSDSAAARGPKAPPARIVYASQDSASITLLRSVAVREGWTLEVVTDGDRCLSRFEKGSPDACLLDFTLTDIATISTK